MIANDEDPYGLPAIPGEEDFDGWTDHSRIEMRNVRIFTRGSLTATLIHHPGLWDLIISDGTGRVDISTPQTDEIAAALKRAGEGTSRA